MKTSFRIGRLGEDLVCRLLGYRRQPVSGGKWPWKEDLVKDTPAGDLAGKIMREIAQVKTTTNVKMLEQYLDLIEYADAEGADATWYEVYLTPNRAWVFERKLIDISPLGLEAVGTVKHGAGRSRMASGNGRTHARRRAASSRVFRGRVQADDPRQGRRRSSLS